MSTIEQRRDQMFPKLRPEEIDRHRRFGKIRRYAEMDPKGWRYWSDPAPGVPRLVPETTESQFAFGRQG